MSRTVRGETASFGSFERHLNLHLSFTDLRFVMPTQAPSLTLRWSLRSFRFRRHCLGFGSVKREVIQNIVFPYVGWKYHDEFHDFVI